MSDHEHARKDLEQSLARAHRAFGHHGAHDLSVLVQPEIQSILLATGGGLGVGGVVLGGLALATTPWLFVPAALLGMGSIAVLAARAVGRHYGPPRTDGAAHVGMGAEVDATARIEPGGTVEMGATVQAGAVISPGAVVRMGATIGKDVVLEQGAIVGWGVTVGDGAIVRQGATLGAGCTVEPGAVVEAGRHFGAGSTVRAAPGAKPPVTTPAPVMAADPRVARVEELCRKLEGELAQSSARVREFLGEPEKTVAALKRTCLDILARETQLRREASPELLARLEQEHAALSAKADAAVDEPIRRSLAGALAAIDEQRRQRQLLRRNADRLEAELTRLTWTLEGLLSQMIRLRSEGGPAGDAALETTVGSLRDELNAVADAVESVQRDERAALVPAGDGPVTFDEGTPTKNRERA